MQKKMSLNGSSGVAPFGFEIWMKCTLLQLFFLLFPQIVYSSVEDFLLTLGSIQAVEFSEF